MVRKKKLKSQLLVAEEREVKLRISLYGGNVEAVHKMGNIGGSR